MDRHVISCCIWFTSSYVPISHSCDQRKITVHGYIDTTELCQLAGKQIKHWNELKGSMEYLNTFAERMFINIDKEINKDFVRLKLLPSLAE